MIGQWGPLRRVGVVVALLAAPVCFIVQGLAGPAGSDDTRTELNQIAANVSGAGLAVTAGLVGTIFMVPALLALTSLVRTRHAVFGDIGGGIAVAGAVGFAALWGVDMVQITLVESHADTGQVVAAWASLEASTPMSLTLVLYIGGLSLGVVLLAIGLWRCRVVPRLVAVPLVAFVVANAMNLPTAAAAGILLVAFGWIAGCVLRRPVRAETASDSRVSA